MLSEALALVLGAANLQQVKVVDNKPARLILRLLFEFFLILWGCQSRLSIGQTPKYKQILRRQWRWFQSGDNHLLPVDVTVLDEWGAADVDGDVLDRLAILDEALLHIVLLAFLLLRQRI